MKQYIKDLAPWEMKNEYYYGVQLGNDVKTQIENIRNYSAEMVKSLVESTDTIVASEARINDVIYEVDYSKGQIGKGLQGLNAAFEWGISDVVWQIEQAREKFRENLDVIYASAINTVRDLKEDAQKAYRSGKIDEALEKFKELLQSFTDDFSAYISLGIIYLFHKTDKEAALNSFDKAINAKTASAYYRSYALLYKALIRRDFGLIEESEKYSNEAIGLTPNLAEAAYQNTQYNALLNKQDKAIPLLKKVIDSDIIYCLKIKKDPAFDGIRYQITKLFGGIRDKKKKEAENKLEGLKERLVSHNTTTSKIEELGYDVPEALRVEVIKEEKDEIAEMINNNSIFDAHIADLHVSQRESILKRKKSELQEKCREYHRELERDIYEKGNKLLGEKKGGGIGAFIIRFILGQFVALPVGIFLRRKKYSRGGEGWINISMSLPHGR